MRARRRGARFGRNFRCIHWESDGEKAEELYDHRNDNHEFMNLAGKAEFKQELERHRELVRA